MDKLLLIPIAFVILALWHLVGVLVLHPFVHRVNELPYNKKARSEKGKFLVKHAAFELLCWPYILWLIRK